METVFRPITSTVFVAYEGTNDASPQSKCKPLDAHQTFD
jgi:hypothetical protein